MSGLEPSARADSFRTDIDAGLIGSPLDPHGQFPEVPSFALVGEPVLNACYRPRL